MLIDMATSHSHQPPATATSTAISTKNMRFQKSLNTQFFVTVFTFFFFIKQLCVLGVFHSVFLDGKTSLKKLFIFEALKIHTMHFSWLARWLAGSLAGCLAGSLAGSPPPTSTPPAPHLHPPPSTSIGPIYFLHGIHVSDGNATSHVCANLDVCARTMPLSPVGFKFSKLN